MDHPAGAFGPKCTFSSEQVLVLFAILLLGGRISRQKDFEFSLFLSILLLWKKKNRWNRRGSLPLEKEKGKRCVQSVLKKSTDWITRESHSLRRTRYPILPFQESSLNMSSGYSLFSCTFFHSFTGKRVLECSSFCIRIWSASAHIVSRSRRRLFFFDPLFRHTKCFQNNYHSYINWNQALAQYSGTLSGMQFLCLATMLSFVLFSILLGIYH